METLKTKLFIEFSFLVQAIKQIVVLNKQSSEKSQEESEISEDYSIP